MIANLGLYHVFMCVARHKSISGASEELFVTQPAVSLSIRKLEEELGTTLFYRTNRGIRLTAAGSVLYEQLKTPLAMIEASEDKLREMSGLRSGSLRIGASDMTLRFFLLDYLEAFRDAHPGITLQVSNNPTPQTLEALKHGLIDFGVISEPCTDDVSSIELFPVREIHDIFVCTDKFPLTDHPVSVEELSAYPLIMLERETSTRRYVEETIGAGSLTPSIELATSDLILEFARRGLGVACIVEDFAAEDLASGRLHKISLAHELPPRRFLLAHMKKPPLPAAAAHLVKQIRSQLAKSGEPCHD